jgi:mannosyltransferase OCH1-like enzyme
MKNNYNRLLFFIILIISLILLSRLVGLSSNTMYELYSNKNELNKNELNKNKLIINDNVLEILQNGIIKNDELYKIITELINEKKRNINWDIEHKIPKQLHFIWIGSKIPQKYIDNIITYITNNKEYIINIWLDDNTLLQEIPDNLIPYKDNVKLHNVNEISLINKKGFEIMENYGGKADILRYEIIFNYGGMYIDVDSVSKKIFDDNFTKPFVAINIESYKNLSNAQFGFCKGSPFLDFVISVLNKNIELNLTVNGNLNDILSITGPPFFTTCFYYWGNLNIQAINQYYIINNNDNSYSYHTNDANWLKK